MDQNLIGQERLRPVIILIAWFDIVYSCFQLGLGIQTRKSSFTFNATSLEVKNEAPEAELNISIPIISVVDFVSIIVAIMLLVGVTKRRVHLVFIWIYYTILRLGWEIIIVILNSQPTPSTSMRLTWWFCYAVIAVFIVFNLREIVTEMSMKPAQPLQSARTQGEDNPPAYEDVVPSSVETESEVPCGRYDSPPSYNQFI